MTKQQSELCALVAYEIGVRGETFNWAVMYDTVSVLYQLGYSNKDLRLMITNEHPEFVGISEQIQLILADTYSEAAMELLKEVN